LDQRRRDRNVKDGLRKHVRGLLLTFLLSFVNLVGVVFTLTALGGLAPWSHWQFIGAYGLVELGSGLANVISPNFWQLPIAELETSDQTETKLAGSALLLPHWGALARCAAGLLLVAIAAWHEGVTLASAGVVPLVLGLAWLVLAVSAAIGRAAVARPELDVVQLTVRWGGRVKESDPASLSAALLQFVLSISTVPAAKLLSPAALYQPELAPSVGALVAILGACAVLGALVYVLWAGRISLRAPREQQRQAEEQA
jgi:hypothetical protein